jgi:hypothetical protein
LIEKGLAWADLAVKIQNLENKGFIGKLFGINRLRAIRAMRSVLATAVRFGERASMTLLFSFHIHGQGYASQSGE